MMLRRNVNDLERLLRVILGIYAMLLGFLFISGLVGNILGFVGLVVFVTGAVGWCGIYALMGRELPQSAALEPVEEAPAAQLADAEPLENAMEQEVETEFGLQSSNTSAVEDLATEIDEPVEPAVS